MATPLVLSAFEVRTLAFRASFGDVAQVGQTAAASRGGPGNPALVDKAASISRASESLKRLGYVQIDTISVIERAHHHVLWSRDRDYRPTILPALEAEPRQAFEYWAHAAAYLPLADYRYCLPRMRRIAAQGHEWFPSDHRVIDWVRDRIRAEGSLRSQDFESEGARGPWWDWKPAKAALEFLFQSGELMVATRPGFQKLYDLAERVLPAGVDTSFPSEAEMGDWYVRRAASALGVFTLRDIAYQRKDGTAGVAGALERACEVGMLQPCVVQGLVCGSDGTVGPVTGDGRTVGGGKAVKSWCDSGLLSRCAGLGVSGFGDRGSRAWEPEGGETGGDEGRPVRILSPFDNLVIDRKRANRIFGLNYTIECYVPAAKRKFGYFALPVFFKERPIGLLDCKTDRKKGVLMINRAGFDWGPDPARGPDGFVEAFTAELAAFAAFNGCNAF